jgi:diguanylate cyclase (GGDEF)-like protein
MDIDHFKRINDSYGHSTGDWVLAEVARGIRSLLRNNDVLARYGGEEFVALLSSPSERQSLEAAERIRQHVAQLEILAKNGRRVNVRLSIGIATLDPKAVDPGWPVSADKLINQADQALYRAKNSGRNRVINGGVLQNAPKKIGAGGRH